MDVTIKKSRQILRFIAAWVLLAAPLLAMPLAYGRLGGSPVPLYGLVKCVTLPVMTVISLAVIAMFPANVLKIFRNPALKLPLIAAGLYTVVLAWQMANALITSDEFLGGLFYVAAPLAAAALNGELRKCLPYFAGAAALLLFWSGCTSENFTGLTGNWNWTCGILTALIPAVFLAGKYRCWKIYSLAALGIFFTAAWFIDPVRFPRSAMLAALAAIAVIALRERIPQKHFAKITAAVMGMTIVGFFLFIANFDLPDTRFQIWRGALEALMHDPLTGAGAGHFSEIIRLNLYDAFYFTEFPSSHIDHAHNDLLNIFTECGIFGALLYLSVIFAVFCRRDKSDSGMLAKWIFTVLIVCGCFDQHNITVMGASLLAISAGIVLLPERPNPPSYFRNPVPALIIGAILLVLAVNMMIVNWQTTGFIRQGDLKLHRGDLDGALSEYSSSWRQKPTCHALYQSAELRLVKGDPETALSLISDMETKLHIVNYRHTQRLKAIAAFQTGDLATSAQALNIELSNAPFSAISAHFQCFLMRAANMDEATVAEADRHLLMLCRMRNIEPQTILQNFPPEADDAAFAPEVRQSRAGEKSVIVDIAMNLLGAILLLAGAYGIGRLLLWKLPDAGALPALACGMIVTGAAAIAVTPQSSIYLLAIPALPGAWFAIEDIRKNWKRALTFFLIFLPLLPAALLPPTAWDEQVYQIALLKKYVESSSTAVLMSNPYSAYPSLGQLFTLPGFAFGGLNVPMLTIWAISCIMAAKFHAAASRYGKLAAALATAAIFLSPLSCTMLRSFYVETFIVLYGFAGAQLILSGKAEKCRWQIALAGVMAGAAAAVKLTGIGVSLMLFTLLLTDREKRRQWWCFIAGALITVLPFFLRVWIACGNPFYPYFSGIFGMGESACMVEGFHHSMGSSYGMGPVTGIFLNWLTASVDGSAYDGIVTGCQFILFTVVIIAALIKVRFRHPMLMRGAAVLLVGWLFWNFTSQQTRFLYPNLWAAAFLMVYASSIFTLKIRQIILLALGMLTAISFYVELELFKHYPLAWRTFGEARKNPGHFAAWIHDEEAYAELITQMELIKDHKVALLWERRTLYLPGDPEIITPGFQEAMTPIPENADAFYTFLQRYDYLVIRLPLTDVDQAVEAAPGAVEVNLYVLDLLQQGKLLPAAWTSDGQLSILRIVPET